MHSRSKFRYITPAFSRPLYAHPALIVLSVMASVGALAQDGALTRDEAYARAQALEALGRNLLFDPALSASGKMACATCHDPAHGFAPANASSVQLGGKDMRQAGIRNVPSLTYLQSVPAFSQHFFESEDEGDSSIDNGPTGGLAWDGRADRGRDQARAPLLSPFEMVNESPQAVVARARAAGYGLRIARHRSGTAKSGKAFSVILAALEAFEQSWRDFYPYSSKYDFYLAGRVQLSPQELRGLAAFNDPKKGNCAHCHYSARAMTAPRRSSRTLASLRSGCRAIRRSPPMRTRSFTILGCAVRCARILRTKPSIAVSFARRAYVMLRFARVSSTTA